MSRAKINSLLNNLNYERVCGVVTVGVTTGAKPRLPPDCAHSLHLLFTSITSFVLELLPESTDTKKNTKFKLVNVINLHL